LGTVKFYEAFRKLLPHSMCISTSGTLPHTLRPQLCTATIGQRTGLEEYSKFAWTDSESVISSLAVKTRQNNPVKLCLHPTTQSVCDGSKSYNKNLQNDSNKDIVTTHTHTTNSGSPSHCTSETRRAENCQKKLLRQVYCGATKEITAA